MRLFGGLLDEEEEEAAMERSRMSWWMVEGGGKMVRGDHGIEILVILMVSRRGSDPAINDEPLDKTKHSSNTSLSPSHSGPACSLQPCPRKTR